jgi:hypothetical protein
VPIFTYEIVLLDVPFKRILRTRNEDLKFQRGRPRGNRSRTNKLFSVYLKQFPDIDQFLDNFEKFYVVIHRMLTIKNFLTIKPSQNSEDPKESIRKLIQKDIFKSLKQTLYGN